MLKKWNQINFQSKIGQTELTFSLCKDFENINSYFAREEILKIAFRWWNCRDFPTRKCNFLNFTPELHKVDKVWHFSGKMLFLPAVLRNYLKLKFKNRSCAFWLVKYKKHNLGISLIKTTEVVDCFNIVIQKDIWMNPACRICIFNYFHLKCFDFSSEALSIVLY